jgi:F420H(2)-dependent quinone reductase
VFARLTVLFDRAVGRRSYRIHRVVYRWTWGIIGHRTMVGPMLLLTTTGRKTGQQRTTPLLYMPDGARYLVVGSNGGREQPPAWILNVAATPAVRIQVGRRRLAARAEVVSPEERAALWPRMTEYYKGWAHYEDLTDRALKVVVLTPRP